MYTYHCYHYIYDILYVYIYTYTIQHTAIWILNKRTRLFFRWAWAPVVALCLQPDLLASEHSRFACYLSTSPPKKRGRCDHWLINHWFPLIRPAIEPLFLKGVRWEGDQPECGKKLWRFTVTTTSFHFISSADGHVQFHLPSPIHSSKRHWASGRLGNDLSDKKQMKAGNISGWKKKTGKAWLVGGWTNPFEKYARQIGSFPPIFGGKKKQIELPPPR